MQDLFGNEINELPGKAPHVRIAVHQYNSLILIYGKTDGKKCIDCVNCQRHEGGSKRFYKCHLASISHGPATDWNSRWQACGKFEPEPEK